MRRRSIRTRKTDQGPSTKFPEPLGVRTVAVIWRHLIIRPSLPVRAPDRSTAQIGEVHMRPAVGVKLAQNSEHPSISRAECRPRGRGCFAGPAQCGTKRAGLL